MLNALRKLKNRLRIAVERRRYRFTYSREFYEQGYHDKLHDVGGDDLSAWETRGYRARLYEALSWCDRLAPNAFTGRHLEVACMYGKTAFWLAERYPTIHVDAFDFSARFVALARSHNPFPDRITIAEGDITAIAHADASFDSASCIDVTEHLPDDVYRQGLRELARVLRPGGHLLLMQGNTPQVEHIHILPESELIADVVGVGFQHLGTYVVREGKAADYFHLFQM